MVGTVGRGIKDDIGAIVSQLSIGLINQGCFWQSNATLQLKVFQGEGLSHIGYEPADWKLAMMERFTFR